MLNIYFADKKLGNLFFITFIKVQFSGIIYNKLLKTIILK